jgi:hypothetical protein
MKFIFSKLNKIKNKKKWFSLFLIFIIVLIIPSFFVIKNSNINADIKCQKIKLDEKSCQFECNVTPNYIISKETNKIQTRIIVMHSAWTAIFDKTYEFNVNKENKFTFQIPRRNYDYYLYVSMWDNEKNIGSLKEPYSILC